MEVIGVEHLPVLNAIDLRRLLDTEDIMAFVGGARDDTEALVGGLADEGLIVRRDGRRSGWMLTELGTARLDELRAAEMADPEARAAVEQLYEGFLSVNGKLKQLFSDWQVRPGPEPVPNDHTDPEYDRGIIERLHELDASVRGHLVRTSQVVARFESYPRRLSEALDRVDAGEIAAVARPMSGSYHDVWMELHQDLLTTLGRERGDADGH